METVTVMSNTSEPVFSEDIQISIMWKTMENLQEEYPHLWFGWSGFVPAVYFA